MYLAQAARRTHRDDSKSFSVDLLASKATVDERYTGGVGIGKGPVPRRELEVGCGSERCRPKPFAVRASKLAGLKGWHGMTRHGEKSKGRENEEHCKRRRRMKKSRRKVLKEEVKRRNTLVKIRGSSSSPFMQVRPMLGRHAVV